MMVPGHDPSRQFKKPLFVSVVLLCLFSLFSGKDFARAQAVGGPLWQQAPSIQSSPEPGAVFTLDSTHMHASLAQAPIAQEGVDLEWQQGAWLSLPLPGGGAGRFRVLAWPVMDPELAARYPEIHTYIALGVDDPGSSARLDLTPLGFHAMIFSSQGTIFIDPEQYSTQTALTPSGAQNYMPRLYRSYWVSETLPSKQTFFELGVLQAPGSITIQKPLAQIGTSGGLLRTYRLGIAATGEYTRYFGGRVVDGLSAIVTAVNRLDGIYQRDLAIHLVLVADEDRLIYTDPMTDPYDNQDGFAMLDQNQKVLDGVLGQGGYDIGHVFSTGGGGIAYVGVVCMNSYKAQGVTGMPEPQGDPFWVDYVAHEMGHQFGANHTFNSQTGGCGGNNRAPATAYEPGSGSTIMGYAGICGPDDLQPHSDDYFHIASLQEISTFTTQSIGSLCPVVSPTGNSPPQVDAGTGGFTIPARTPFTLVGSGNDPDGDQLTYTWEQYDLGPAGSPETPYYSAPLFRSFPPSGTALRTFPRLADLLTNTHTIGEKLPTISRTLNFRLTARDQHPQSLAGGFSYDTLSFKVTSLAGPFQVTRPNTDTTWVVGQPVSVTWNVANTDQFPVSCPAVDLLLSLDGGYTYPLTLAGATPNDGAEMVIVPAKFTEMARVKVACASSIFFDISDTNFHIRAAQAYLELGQTVSPHEILHPGSTVTYTLTITNQGALTATTTLTGNLPPGLTNPQYAGKPGFLNVSSELASGASASYNYRAQVDPALSVLIAYSVDRLALSPDSMLTYILTATNPSPVITLTQVTLQSTSLSNCLPALSVPQILGPGQSQRYLCSQPLVESSPLSQLSASASLIIVNTFSALSPQDSRGILFSPPALSRVDLSAQVELRVPWMVIRKYYFPDVWK